MLQEDALAVFDTMPFLGGVGTGQSIALAGARWLTPCEPQTMIGLWNNFHAATAKHEFGIPPEPLYFLKARSCHAAHEEMIPRPGSYDGRVVYEGELGIVIGKECRAVSRDQAQGHIFGYTCVNDVTALELIQRDPSFAQWSRAKSFDGFGAFGPAIATGIDPGVLVVRTTIDGRERQNYPVSDMIFDPFEIVSRISHDITLYPGDLIACGTSLGTLPMRDGTVADVTIDGIGTLRNVFGIARS
jgi:2-keto-4-pentenoate hydratase/2-oxohepta-3-ene-1,7-dioic acid hydratase in catechol pathway